MMYQVVNPATGKVESEYPTATDAEVADVLARAERGYTSWRRTPMEERAGILRRVSPAVSRPLHRTGRESSTREMGKVTKGAKGSATAVALRPFYEYYADNGAGAPRGPQGRCPASNLPGTAWVAQEPDRRAAWASCVELPVLTRSAPVSQRPNR